MLFISTGIFDDKFRPQILSVDTTANADLRPPILNAVKKKESRSFKNNAKTKKHYIYIPLVLDHRPPQLLVHQNQKLNYIHDGQIFKI